MLRRVSNPLLLEFYGSCNDLIRGVLDLHGFIAHLQSFIDV
jgi:hypothetical protein